jgi:hypothetical protein
LGRRWRLLKNVSADELARAIHAAYVLVQTARQTPKPGFYLTAREWEVLAPLVEFF